MYTDSKDSSSKFVVSIIVVILLLIGIAALAFLNRDKLSRWAARDIIEQEKLTLAEKIQTLENEMQTLKDEAATQVAPIPDERASEVFGLEAQAPVEAPSQEKKDRAAPVEDVCESVQARFRTFMGYLEKQDYVAEREIQEGIRGRFTGILSRLLASPPVVAGETDTLLGVLKNSAHFFRVLGKKDTLLLRDILNKERDVMEPTFELLYQVIELQDECRKRGRVAEIPLQDAYEYAAFFLNTLGGRSYLMRRDPRVRILAQYYSILVLDLANERKLNRWGIDLRGPLNTLIEEIKGSNNLSGRADYLRRLNALKKKYSKLYGHDEGA